jgi:hypothetical protein
LDKALEKHSVWAKFTCIVLIITIYIHHFVKIIHYIMLILNLFLQNLVY